MIINADQKNTCSTTVELMDVNIAWENYREEMKKIIEYPLVEAIAKDAFNRGWWMSRGVPF